MGTGREPQIKAKQIAMPAGRPPKHSSPEKFAAEIVAYFDNCDKGSHMPNKAGLASG
jgi:hypothetical protein